MKTLSENRTRFTIFLHPDVEKNVQRIGQPSVSKRLAFSLRNLAVFGRVGKPKGTVGKNSGWRRTSLGDKFHYYLWWRPEANPDIPGKTAIYIRDARLHDDTELLTIGDRSEYTMLSRIEIQRNSGFEDPWTKEQNDFLSNKTEIRFLQGYPGTGKTTVLWEEVCQKTSGRIVYITWSKNLAAKTIEWIGCNDNLGLGNPNVKVDVYDIRSFVSEIIKEDIPLHPERTSRREFEKAIKAKRLSPKNLGPWRNSINALYDEIRAHLIGTSSFDSNKSLLVFDLKKWETNRIKDGLSKSAVEAAEFILKKLNLHDPEVVNNFFPDLVAAARARGELSKNHRFIKTIKRVTQIIIDEVQDLTSVEYNLLIDVIAALKKESKSINVVFAGDEGQTVRPTAFDWGQLSKTVTERLSQPQSITLPDNLRNPDNIAAVVERSNELYTSVPKSERPRGRKAGASGIVASDRIFLTSSNNIEDIIDIIKVINESTDAAVISVTEDLPEWLQENCPDMISFPADVKGLEYSTVCLVGLENALKIIQLFKDKEITDTLSRRSNIDRLRVAVSRSTASLSAIEFKNNEEEFIESRILLEPEEVTPHDFIPEIFGNHLVNPEDHESISGILDSLSEEAAHLLEIRPVKAWDNIRKIDVLLQKHSTEVYRYQRFETGTIILKLLWKLLTYTEDDLSDFNRKQITDMAIRYASEVYLQQIIPLTKDLVKPLSKISAEKRLRWVLKLAEIFNSELFPWILDALAPHKHTLIKDIMNSSQKHPAVIADTTKNALKTLPVLLKAHNELNTVNIDRLLLNLAGKTEHTDAHLCIKLLELNTKPPKDFLARVYEKAGRINDSLNLYSAIGMPDAALEIARRHGLFEKSIRFAQQIEDKNLVEILKTALQMQTRIEKLCNSGLTDAEKAALGKALITLDFDSLKKDTIDLQNRLNAVLRDYDQKISNLDSIHKAFVTSYNQLCTTMETAYSDALTAKEEREVAEQRHNEALQLQKDLENREAQLQEDRDALEYKELEFEELQTQLDEKSEAISVRLQKLEELSKNTSKAALENESLRADLKSARDELDIAVDQCAQLSSKIRELEARLSEVLNENEKLKHEKRQFLQQETAQSHIQTNQLTPAPQQKLGSDHSSDNHICKNSPEYNLENTANGLCESQMEQAQGDGERIMSLQDLADANNGVLNQSLLLELMEAILLKISHEHVKGIVLYDLKPANILLSPKPEIGFTIEISENCQVELVDGDVSQSPVSKSVWLLMGDTGKYSTGDQAALGKQKGVSIQALLETWDYMAPEQQNGKEAGTRSNVYSLGLMCYQLLTGQKLSFLLPSRIMEGVLPEWDDFVAGALENKPENRYADAVEMLELMKSVRNAIDKAETTKLQKKNESEIAATHQNASEPISTPTPTLKPEPIPEGIFANTYHKQEMTFNLGEGVELSMVYIEGEKFQMGSLSDECDRTVDEGPVHSVELDGFWMGKFEVTQAQYRAIMGSNPSFFQGDDRPVERVSWDDAMEFCQKLSQKTGITFTLPTEAQWEYACRAGATTRYCFGDDKDLLSEYAWYGFNSNNETHPVGQKKPSAWGLYDMHGNVWEWCLDKYDDMFYKKSPQRNPVCSDFGSNHVRRGGGWNSNVRHCRSASRGKSGPSHSSSRLGFRLVIADSSEKTAIHQNSSEPISTPIPALKSESIPAGLLAHTYNKQEVRFDLSGRVKLSMVYIEGGSFQMGSLPGEFDRGDDEAPVHTVELDGFWMGKFAVTQAQYLVIMGSNPSFFHGDDRPVERVSWDNAMEFCQKLSQKTGITFTLPTEAQWEYACRAGSAMWYCFGDDIDLLSEYAWYADNSNHKTHPVGQKESNAWGLYDMHGNVWEWCLDCYDRMFYTISPRHNPVCSNFDSNRIRRGGSWGSYSRHCRSAYRDNCSPSYTSSFLGFRLVIADPSETAAIHQYASAQNSISVLIPDNLLTNPFHKQKTTFDLGGGVELSMVYIVFSSNRKGSSFAYPERSDHQSPVHVVELDGFWIGIFAVTQAQYRAIIGTNPSLIKGDDHPVERVSWYDAMEFCQKLSEKTGKTFTLPSEALWEYACQAGTKTLYSFGDEAGLLSEHAWYGRNSNHKTHPVGQKKPNAWGLYDMHGNVWEWCIDWHDSGYNMKSPWHNSVGCRADDRRCVRGGGWDSNQKSCRSENRSRRNASDSHHNLGFRIMMIDSRRCMQPDRT